MFICLSIIKSIHRWEEYMSDLLLTLCDAAELDHHYHLPFLSSICYFLWPTFPYFSDSITIGQIFSWTFTNNYLSSISYDEYFHIGILRKMRFSQIYILRMWGESGLNFLCKISAHIVIGLDLPSHFPFLFFLTINGKTSTMTLTAGIRKAGFWNIQTKSNLTRQLIIIGEWMVFGSSICWEQGQGMVLVVSCSFLPENYLSGRSNKPP